nr:DUF5009 domain-containing protein [Parashewanella spongiae]
MFWIIGGEFLFSAFFVFSGWSGWLWFDDQMKHSQGHGFTAYDLIFPLFIFLSGITLGLSAKCITDLDFKARLPTYRKAVFRLFLLLSFGVLYNHGWGTGLPAAEDIRYASVLGRIAFAWFFAFLLVYHTQLRTQIFWVIGILVGYSSLQLCAPLMNSELSQFDPETSINAWIDSHFLPGQIYQQKSYDPEGLLSTLPAICNALFGFFVGQYLIRMAANSKIKVAIVLTLIGVVILGLGWLIDMVIPVNKDLWTSSFVLVSVGWSVLIFSLFYMLVDVLGFKKLVFPFVVIGCNAIIVYLASSLINWKYTSNSLFGQLITNTAPYAQPLMATVTLLLVQWLVLWWLYQRKIFIRT